MERAGEPGEVGEAGREPAERDPVARAAVGEHHLLGRATGGRRDDVEVGPVVDDGDHDLVGGRGRALRFDVREVHHGLAAVVLARAPDEHGRGRRDDVDEPRQTRPSQPGTPGGRATGRILHQDRIETHRQDPHRHLRA